MAIFDRIRRGRAAAAATTTLPPVEQHLLPEINQRITIARGEHVPVPSRIEDVGESAIQIAMPALPLEFGDSVVLTWERDDAWCSLDTRVLGVDEDAAVPTVHLAAAGRLRRFDERRADARREIALPIELQILSARAIRAGRELTTVTTEVSGTAIRFATTASFAPGDTMEARIRVSEGETDVVSARVRVVRVDAVSGSWRSTCTVTFEEILRSDRARLIALAEVGSDTPSAPHASAELELEPLDVQPPSPDGIGGRDEPQPIGSYEEAVAWLRRRS